MSDCVHDPVIKHKTHERTYFIFGVCDYNCVWFIEKFNSSEDFRNWFETWIDSPDRTEKDIECARNFMSTVLDDKRICWTKDFDPNDSLSILPTNFNYTFSLHPEYPIYEIFIVDNPDTDKYLIEECKSCLCEYPDPYTIKLTNLYELKKSQELNELKKSHKYFKKRFKRR
jgi:hypothetical protein